MYILDTSVWIHVGRNHPPDIFATLWGHIEDAIARGEIRSPDEVLRELEEGHDTLAPALAGKVGLFVPLDAGLQAAATEVLARCPQLVDPDSTRNRADPFVVALARQLQGTVVTQERPRRGATGRPKIPDACVIMAMNPSMDWFDFLRRAGWRL